MQPLSIIIMAKMDGLKNAYYTHLLSIYSLHPHAVPPPSASLRLYAALDLCLAVVTEIVSCVRESVSKMALACHSQMKLLVKIPFV